MLYEKNMYLTKVDRTWPAYGPLT